ncbi:hypothetical protein [Amycolatopsis pithecellobii]|uniref:Cupin domain-containing protein n=1 Tax=Amycolatopsis pithecellobii TaxID=664692 RepID=A0A6N7YXP1_9PSEU|nr:hypothetical protein [Amycolatopsis pithecellobii]MTD53109.1 hypothetical protein [Amycolatopsis pithecellobii]
MDVVVARDVATQAQDKGTDSSLRPGGVLRQMLFHDNAPDGLSFKFFRSQYLPGDKAFTSPRHHHAFQQLRWTESGEINYGPGQYIRAREMAYFPRGAYYGPQVKDTGVGLLLQLGFHGEHQYGGVWANVREEAIKRLKEKGTFAEGVFVDTDPDTGERRERDSGQALYEEQYAALTGNKFVVPEEGYDSPILLHPQAFDYYEAAPGVEVKHLGSFFDHPGPHADIRLSVVRLSPGGTYHFGPERGQIAWTTDPGLRVEDSTYPELTYLYSPRDEKAEISAEGTVEIFVVEFPRLD